MFFSYPVICHYEDGGYWSEFPDLDACFSQGETVDEIISNSKESLEGFLESCLERNVSLPKPTLITELHAEGKDFLSYVTCDIAGSGKSIRKNVTLPEWLAAKAEKAGVNFSQTLQDALRQRLGIASLG